MWRPDRRKLRIKNYKLKIKDIFIAAFVVISAIGEVAFAQSHEQIVSAANQGDTNALIKLGVNAELQNNYSSALNYYSKAASLGNTDALVFIGQLYEFGGGVKQNYANALTYYTKSANLGNSTAIYNIGNLYENGHGVKQDYTKAMQYYQKSASLRNAHAMLAISNMYSSGKGVAKNNAKADEWYEKSQMAFAGYQK